MNQILDLFEPMERRETGTAVVLVNRGEIIERYWGLANIEHGVPVGPQTVFPMASVSKQFTAMIIMMLVEEGKLSYCHRLDVWFNFSWAKDLSILNLLQHTSGIPDPYNWYLDKKLNWYGLNNQDVLEFLKDRELEFGPSQQFQYSNSNYILLALITERISGKGFGALLKDLIFSPLGMKDSLLFTRRQVIPNRAYGYRSDGGEYLHMDLPWLTYGDGGIMTTPRDFIKWDRALSQGRLICKDSYIRAFTPGKDCAGNTLTYGFGWSVGKIGDLDVVWHAGSDPGFGSMYFRVPAKEFSILMLGNVEHCWEEFAQIRKDIFKLIEEESV